MKLRPPSLSRFDDAERGFAQLDAIGGALQEFMPKGVDVAAGALWLNAADTYVDVWKATSADGRTPQLRTTWLSEGGAVDALDAGAQPAAHFGQLRVEGDGGGDGRRKLGHAPHVEGGRALESHRERFVVEHLHGQAELRRHLAHLRAHRQPQRRCRRRRRQ